MARSHAATTCVQSDSIKGMAQSIAKPAYNRRLIAEPLLRRAVPTLIIAFLITICIGAFVQVLDQTRQKRESLKRELSALADVLSDRLNHTVLTREDRAASADKLQALLPDLMPSWGFAGGRHIIVARGEQIIARFPSDAGSVDTRMLGAVSAAQLLTLRGTHASAVDIDVPGGPHGLAAERTVPAHAARARRSSFFRSRSSRHGARTPHCRSPCRPPPVSWC